jgi:hypothetical protein
MNRLISTGALQGCETHKQDRKKTIKIMNKGNNEKESTKQTIKTLSLQKNQEMRRGSGRI